MDNDKKNAKTESDLNKLEKQVDELIKICDELKGENHLLRERQESLVTERATLIEKTELARIRVEAMIDRLKSLESEQ
ncbi:MAG: TIGR02449 family protein [Gammaproteobacteria bacterium]|nr:TIGR02449 family protein [Gammaproteobacteria bacterium]